MSHKVFVISDPHFSHAGICKFLRNDVTKLRPWDDVKEMDEAIVSNWNSVVRDVDKIYVLGDVVFHKRDLPILYRLNGKKILVKGNHDTLDLKDYLPHFKDIRSYSILKQYIMSHIPIHPESLGRWKGNIHGHTHSNLMKLPSGEIDKRYICACVEWTNYTPIEFDELVARSEVVR